MNQVNIIFVHSGNLPPPVCMLQSIAIACRIAPLSKVVALINERYIEKLNQKLSSKFPSGVLNNADNFQVVPIEALSLSKFSEDFRSHSKADREFRGGFWLETANRFMLIADLMAQFNLSNCLHLENDNVIYFDPTEKLNVFRSHARFSVPFDRSRAIPGIVWYRDSGIAKELALYLQEHSDMPDFDALRQFCDSGLYDARPLPTMTRTHAAARGLPEKNYCLGYEEFGGIFDAAAIGQYIGGVDPRNISGDSRFFINETSDLDLSKCDITWKYSGQSRSMLVKMENEFTEVLSLHAHSKDSLGVSPFNCALIDSVSEIITGEGIQESANLTITSKAVTAFHGSENIRTKEILEIPQKKIGKFFKKKFVDIAPDEEWIERCQNNRIIFIYTHLIPYFKKYVASRLSSPFILISHNSDDGVTVNDLDLLNHPFLARWFAQNCEFNHQKLSALPIGLTNRQWGESKYSQLVNAGKNNRKIKSIYANFRLDTHNTRCELFEIVGKIQSIEFRKNLSYEDYLSELAQHKFCLCPRGNGMDTHRFWEAQYLNVIPIIIKADWTPAYSGLPTLVLDSWQELNFVDAQLAYLKISNTSYERPLLLSDYTKKINIAEIIID